MRYCKNFGSSKFAVTFSEFPMSANFLFEKTPAELQKQRS